MQLKQGEKFRWVVGMSLYGRSLCPPVGTELTVQTANESGGGDYYNFTDGTCSYCKHIDPYLPSNVSLMASLLEKGALLFKSEPEKSFRKAGITNGDDILTDDGVKLFLSWMLKKHANEFKEEVVDKLLANEEKK